MGRRTHARVLDVWANGKRVGQWRIPARGPEEFQYDPAWCVSAEARPLSLSLPMNLDQLPLKGETVGFYFDNLLPDSESIRRRLQSRFRTQSRDAFDLLAAIGRDCVGAVQLLPEDEVPEGVFCIQAEQLEEADIERLLAEVVTPPARQAEAEDEDFRISLAGAQEKTALTWHKGRWCRPRGATPTTHIFKLPMGRIGRVQADMSNSVENEWLCATLLHAYGLPIARCEIQRFGARKALVVERFDRRLEPSGQYWLRLPQEDFCQATGTPGTSKYESDGGPGLLEIARILHNSEVRDADLTTLLRAQLLFWLLGAIDGHAKNFSLALLAGGRYRLTPLYDVLSAWPISGHGPNLLERNKLKLAMALRGKNAHYHINEIQRSHFNATAKRCGFGLDMDAIIEEVLSSTPVVLDRVAGELPEGFPLVVFEAVRQGVLESAKKLVGNRSSIPTQSYP
ncbi:MAG: type II toxin-antitoxin system HipA family toxin [Pseudomonadota bacterium]|nr:type II toxin-antitoxin system HipA family toxin [Pseudomonadota bacterium]MDP1904932.1 type II toxin-antitoxin system HipA family toxin [Pseudomonadota bacterium]MDP2352055.1 type II toxin-antitoxin system HipA family toxin [Pseudomonadota bacterium]